MRKLDNRMIDISFHNNDPNAHDNFLAKIDLSNITSLGKILELDGTGSGLDADLVRGLPADFSANLNDAGYQKLPSGLIIQWGGPVTVPSGGGQTWVTFPIAFPNKVLHISISVRNAAHEMIGFDNETTTGFHIRTGINDGNDREAYWIAIGY